ncbi:hypothetical protein TWF696_003201 [Orbilia brochopaga]|uniref:AB hydrolase-1 domain-containing protein n=1 Tax=Orbilia brochopaga TaxID=3140254 RepID=A0AAV9TXS8_9PEZI
MGIASFASQVFVVLVGVGVLGRLALGAAISGAFIKPVSKKKKEARLQARDELWDLSVQPLPGFHHRFFQAADGVNLHYVEGGDTSSDSPLVVFVHGFPDSWFIWHHQLSSPSIQQKAHLIAVDLPGYGGSDAHAKASATAVLTSLASFIIAQKEQKTSERCILVTHDWGSVVGFRLAAEVGFLFERCIIMNAVHPALVVENATRATSSAARILRTYIRNPTNSALLRSAFYTLKPLLTRLRCSYYISAMLLPLPLARQMVKMGDCFFLRICRSMARFPNEETYLANVLGPSKASADGYPASVIARQDINRRADGMIAYYRDNLAFGRWDKPENIQLLCAAAETSAGFTGLVPKKEGSFGCPVTIVYGGRDSAFHRRFCYEGLEEYLPRGKGKSYLVCFPRAGHWPMVASPGRESVDMLMEGALDGVGSEELKERVERVDKDVIFEIEK